MLFFINTANIGDVVFIFSTIMGVVYFMVRLCVEPHIYRAINVTIYVRRRRCMRLTPRLVGGSGSKLIRLAFRSLLYTEDHSLCDSWGWNMSKEEVVATIVHGHN